MQMIQADTTHTDSSLHSDVLQPRFDDLFLLGTYNRQYYQNLQLKLRFLGKQLALYFPPDKKSVPSKVHKPRLGQLACDLF